MYLDIVLLYMYIILHVLYIKDMNFILVYMCTLVWVDFLYEYSACWIMGSIHNGAYLDHSDNSVVKLDT